MARQEEPQTAAHAARPAPRDLPRAEVFARLPVVAIVGRPNTGKSTLFNRITGSRRAVVASTPGVTRDRNVAPASHAGRRFLLIDTGGFEEVEQAEMGRAVRAQSVLAAEQADLVIVVLDGRAGSSALDRALVDRLRRLKKPFLLAVNKIDTPRLEHLQAEFFTLGAEELFPISAEHGLNVDDFLDEVVQRLPEVEELEREAESATAVAIIGRPNVGKSSLLNRLVGYERSIVTAIPGTTRDAIDTRVVRDGRGYLLVDTAGIRRRPKTARHEVERVSVVRALHALERAEVGLLVIDAVEGMTEQDARISGYAWERGRALLLIVNKWDAVARDQRERQKLARHIDERFPSLAVVPKLFVSALTGAGVDRIWSAVDRVAAAHRARLQTSRLNQVIGDAVRAQPPPLVKGRRPRFLYAAQTATSPPTMTIFTSAPEHVQPAYERYLLNRIRAAFPLEGTPIRLRYRARRRRGED